MSRFLDRRCCCSRWSEPILRRHHATHLPPTSEGESSSVQRSRSTSPLLTISQPHVSQLDSQIGCCVCQNRRRKRSSKIHSTTDTKKLNGVRIGLQGMRESLELQLVGTQVEEAMAADRQSALIQHLDLATTALEALIQHVRSLQVSHTAAYRVVDLSHQLILPYSVSTNYSNSTGNGLTMQMQQAEIRKETRLLLLKEVVENCTRSITVSKQLQAVMDEYRMRKEDFSVAARNLKNLLDNTKLSVPQLEKLQRQYETILHEYQQSRRTLDGELPRIVRIRLAALRNNFQKVAEFYNDTEYDKHTGNLFKIIGDNLCQDEAAADHLLCDRLEETQEFCQKCKVNRVEKK
ncbi:uncharacterized protein LOC107272252 isoform X2 [Cephus cinctus]|uniref:Uncharacterized protein LOC107272252 isoform X2 n=1 Tax=Cephus cinctus TaxID=211228 RepID=A0AAJ7C8R3_CEPCN|nr:uncharacterized protein LOC107272252 isoform X2 [Cephus cinctus]